MKMLFLSHYHKDFEEIEELASELRLRGIVPWVDKDGGFSLGDNGIEKARKVIREESFGLLLYATEHVFQRQFIKKVEISEAKIMKKQEPQFLLVAIPRSIDFTNLRILSKENFHIDLSGFHTIEIPAGIDIKPKLEEISRHVLSGVLKESSSRFKGSLSIQVSTREILPDETDDILCIDARQHFLTEIGLRENWTCLLRGLRDIKKEIAAQYGRPRLVIHGSKHLTAAFLVGRVFCPFQMEIRQGKELWMTDAQRHPSPLKIEIFNGFADSNALSIEISVTKIVSAAVDRIISEGFRPRIRIQFTMAEKMSEIDGHFCNHMVQRISSEINHAVGNTDIRTIHIFAAVPQGLMIMLGRLFGALPPVQLYEYCGTGYIPSFLVPSGVL